MRTLTIVLLAAFAVPWACAQDVPEPPDDEECVPTEQQPCPEPEAEGEAEGEEA